MKKMKLGFQILLTVIAFSTCAWAQEDGDYSNYSSPADPAPTDSGYSTNYDDPTSQVSPAPLPEYVPPESTEATD